MIKKIGFIAVAFLVSISTFLNIAQASSAVTVTPKTGKAQTSPALPVPSTVTKSKSAHAHPPVRIRLLAMTMGGSAYVLSFALSEIINKNHPWLRVDTVESRGALANLLSMSSEPDIRKDTFVFSTDESNAWARSGRPPLKAPYRGTRAIAAFSETFNVLATLDSRIKSKADMDGKRVMLTQKATSNAIINEALLTSVWNMKPRLSYGTFDSIKDALKDGLVDVGSFNVNGMPGVGYAPIPALSELLTTANVSYIDMPTEDIQALIKKHEFGILPKILPPKSISSKQQNPVAGWTMTLSWWADAEMSDDIVYEIAKTIYENADKFKDYHVDGRLITHKTLARIAVPEELFHAGALKLYREKGLKPGIR